MMGFEINWLWFFAGLLWPMTYMLLFVFLALLAVAFPFLIGAFIAALIAGEGWAFILGWTGWIFTDNWLSFGLGFALYFVLSWFFRLDRVYDAIDSHF